VALSSIPEQAVLAKSRDHHNLRPQINARIVSCLYVRAALPLAIFGLKTTLNCACIRVQAAIAT
jgi:hypothetical protein